MQFDIDGIDKENYRAKPPTHYDGADFQPLRRRMHIRAE